MLISLIYFVYDNSKTTYCIIYPSLPVPKGKNLILKKRYNILYFLFIRQYSKYKIILDKFAHDL